MQCKPNKASIRVKLPREMLGDQCIADLNSLNIADLPGEKTKPNKYWSMTQAPVVYNELGPSYWSFVHAVLHYRFCSMIPVNRVHDYKKGAPKPQGSPLLRRRVHGAHHTTAIASTAGTNSADMYETL